MKKPERENEGRRDQAGHHEQGEGSVGISPDSGVRPELLNATRVFSGSGLAGGIITGPG